MRFIPRKAVVAAGGIVALTGLAYLGTWVVSGDQRLALKSATLVSCGLLAFAVLFVVAGELTQ